MQSTDVSEPQGLTKDEKMNEQTPEQVANFLEFKEIAPKKSVESSRKATKWLPFYVLAATALTAGGLSFAAQSAPSTSPTTVSNPAASAVVQNASSTTSTSTPASNASSTSTPPAASTTASTTKVVNTNFTTAPTISAGSKPQISGAAAAGDDSESDD